MWWFLITALIFLLLGIILTLVVEWYFFSQPLESNYNNAFPSYSPVKIQLPKELMADIGKMPMDSDTTMEDSRLAVNLLVQFFFRELRYQGFVRRFFLQRINQEMEDILSKAGVRKIIKGLKIYDMDLGTQAPVIHGIRVTYLELHPKDGHIETMDVVLSLEYAGELTIAIDAALAYGKSAFLSAKVCRLVGEARLRFTRQPFSHWSFSFTVPPVVDVDITSRVQGRSLSHVTQLVATQIQKLIQKKHTLPSYRIRFKPFFPRPEELLCDTASPTATSVRHGTLEITIMECSRLNKMFYGGQLYCTLALDNTAWINVWPSGFQGHVVIDIKLLRGRDQPLGIIFQQQPTSSSVLDEVVGVQQSTSNHEETKSNKVNENKTGAGGVTVYGIYPGTPAHAYGIQAGDIILQVNETSTSSVDDVLRAVALSDNAFTIRLSRELPRKNSVSVVQSKTDGKKMSEDMGNKNHFKAEINGSQPVVEKRGEPLAEAVTPSFILPGVADTTLPPEALDVIDNINPAAKPISIEEAVEAVQPEPEETTASFKDIPGLDIQKTSIYPLSEVTVINDTRVLQIHEGHMYLNLGVWVVGRHGINDKEMESRTTGTTSLGGLFKSRNDKKRSISDSRDTLIGYISIALIDIINDCHLNTQRHHVSTYKLSPPDVKATLGYQDGLASQPGFDPRLSYGDILLSFVHQPSEGLDISSMNEPIMTSTSFPLTEKSTNIANVDELTKQTEALLQSGIEKNPHDFVLTQFLGARNCDFCRKKIWLREALQCRICGTICHKKCMKGFAESSWCSTGGFASKPLLSANKSSSIQTDTDDSGIGEFIKDVESVLPTDVSELKSYLEDNPFLPTEDEELDELHSAVERLLAREHDESLVHLAKDSGRELYSFLTLVQRREKIASMIKRLETAIEAETAKRSDLALKSESSTVSLEEKKRFEAEMAGCEEKRQALALLLLHYCAGLQHTEDMEDALKLEAQRRTIEPTAQDSVVV